MSEMKEQEKEYIILTQGLTKKYGDFVAVNGLNLHIKKGEIFGLLGPNGAGKTTTTLMLLGLTEPTSGRAFIQGKNTAQNALDIKKMSDIFRIMSDFTQE